MACFITPLVIGVVLRLLRRYISEKANLHLLEYMLIGGALVLAAEHVYHGEITYYPPFLTAMQSPENIPVLLHEISYVGGLITIATVVVWAVSLHLTRVLVPRITILTKIVASLRR
ncbi:MAG: hypothetical protein QXQ90_09555 [Desulfurococcaceae archaeon]